MIINNIKVTDFSLRHFKKGFGGTNVNTTPEQFEKLINIPTYDTENPDFSFVTVLDGYADFCKILISENHAKLRSGSVEITESNAIYLRGDYSARADGELSVFGRWIHLPPSIKAPEAKYMCIIIYSKEQIDKESLAMKKVDEEYVPFEGDWGVVSIQGTMFPEPDPIPVNTMIRNHLGIEFGGSGEKINVEDYEKSVEFWRHHAVVKS